MYNKGIFIEDLLPKPLYDNQVSQGKILVTKHPDLDLYVHRLASSTVVSSHDARVRMHCNGLITTSNDRVVARAFPAEIPFDVIHSREVEAQSMFYDIYENPPGVYLVAYKDPVMGILLTEHGGFDTSVSKYATELLYQKYSNWAEGREAFNSSDAHIFKLIGSDASYIVNQKMSSYYSDDNTDLAFVAKVNLSNGWINIANMHLGVAPSEAWRGPQLRHLGKFKATSSKSPLSAASGQKVPEMHAHEALRMLDDSTSKMVVYHTPIEKLRHLGFVGYSTYAKFVTGAQSEYVRKLQDLSTFQVTTATLNSALSLGVSKAEIMKAVPPIYTKWTSDAVDLQQERHRELRAKIWNNFYHLLNIVQEAGHVVGYDWELCKFTMSADARKLFVSSITANLSEYRTYYFDILDGKSIVGALWSKVRPNFERSIPNSEYESKVSQFLKDVDKVEV